MDSVVLPVVIAFIASTGFWGLFTKLVDRKTLYKKALLALLHDRLYTAQIYYIQKGSISSDEYENLMYMYMPYIEMGGNGTCERLKKEVDKIKIEN